MPIEIGSVVGRKTYNCDILFRVVEVIDDGIFLLQGMTARLKVFAKQEELTEISQSRLLDVKKIFVKTIDERVERILLDRAKNLPKGREFKAGTVLHIDADREYLKLNLKYYEKLGILAVGENIAEKEQSQMITELLKKHQPNILVLTGHDSLSTGQNSTKENLENLDNYRSSGYFIESIKAARAYNPNKDSLIIIAGACQSHYEGIMLAGANLGSSPKRILIHAIDPLMVAEKIAYTHFNEVIGVEEAVANTVTGITGISGFEVRGTLRFGGRI